MDEEQSIFYQQQFYYNESNPSNLEGGKQNYPSITKNHPQLHQEYQPSTMPTTFKAFNPQQFAQHLPQKEKQRYLNMMMHNKSYAGLTHFVNFQKAYETPDFMNDISIRNGQEDYFEKPLHLDELFEHQDPEKIQKKVEQIESKIKEVTIKSLGQLNVSHLVLSKFNQNFDNYRYLNSHINFIKDLQIKLINFMDKMKDVDTDETIIVEVYQFWMAAFTDFVNSVKKHTQKYTLNFMKKIKESSQGTSNREVVSTSSSKLMEAEKRRSWKPSELEMLGKLISSNSSFNQAAIAKVAQELNRTPASISSKIQKLLKDYKANNPDYEVKENMTLLQKIINVLKNYPKGLTRENLISRIDEHYQMGYDKNWTKSVAQILSSRPEICRIKGAYSLNGNPAFDMSKKAFKDKVVNCLLTIPECRGDIKRIVDQYISLYGTTEGISILSQQRRKGLEASISKSLCRYDVFNKENSKTVYVLKQFCDEKEYLDEQIESYIR